MASPFLSPEKPTKEEEEINNFPRNFPIPVDEKGIERGKENPFSERKLIKTLSADACNLWAKRCIALIWIYLRNRENRFSRGVSWKVSARIWVKLSKLARLSLWNYIVGISVDTWNGSLRFMDVFKLWWRFFSIDRFSCSIDGGKGWNDEGTNRRSWWVSGSRRKPYRADDVYGIDERLPDLMSQYIISNKKIGPLMAEFLLRKEYFGLRCTLMNWLLEL